MTATKESIENARILTSEGKIILVPLGNISYGCIRVMEINNKKVKVCYEDVGFGKDTNSISFLSGEDRIYYGNLSPEKAKDCMERIFWDSRLDLSDVPIVRGNCNQMIGSEEFLIETSIYDTQCLVCESLGENCEMEEESNADKRRVRDMDAEEDNLNLLDEFFG